MITLEELFEILRFYGIIVPESERQAIETLFKIKHEK